MKKEWLNKLKHTLKVDYDECRRHLFILGKWIVMGMSLIFAVHIRGFYLDCRLQDF